MFMFPLLSKAWNVMPNLHSYPGVLGTLSCPYLWQVAIILSWCYIYAQIGPVISLPIITRLNRVHYDWCVMQNMCTLFIASHECFYINCKHHSNCTGIIVKYTLYILYIKQSELINVLISHTYWQVMGFLLWSPHVEGNCHKEAALQKYANVCKLCNIQTVHKMMN